jgi:ABC-type dipeptide/oligopeptide/nickel transport system ATPase component
MPTHLTTPLTFTKLDDVLRLMHQSYTSTLEAIAELRAQNHRLTAILQAIANAAPPACSHTPRCDNTTTCIARAINELNDATH